MTIEFYKRYKTLVDYEYKCGKRHGRPTVKIPTGSIGTKVDELLVFYGPPYETDALFLWWDDVKHELEAVE